MLFTWKLINIIIIIFFDRLKKKYYKKKVFEKKNYIFNDDKLSSYKQNAEFACFRLV